MSTVQGLAVILLMGRIIAVIYLTYVHRIQKRLLKMPVEQEVRGFRNRLHLMTLALLAGNVTPIVLDIVVIAGIGRTTPFLIVYAVSNMMSMVIASYMIFSMYLMATSGTEVTEFEARQLKRIKRKK